MAKNWSDWFGGGFNIPSGGFENPIDPGGGFGFEQARGMSAWAVAGGDTAADPGYKPGPLNSLNAALSKPGAGPFPAGASLLLAGLAVFIMWQVGKR